MMWLAVCWSATQSQAGLLDKPHLHITALKRPTPVRSLLILTQAYRGRSDPGQLLDGEVIYSRSLLVDGCHSTNYILMGLLVSLGRVVDRRSFPLAAKGGRDFSLGCVSSGNGVMEEVIWVHGMAGHCQTCCSPTKLCWWDACKHRKLLYWCRL